MFRKLSAWPSLLITAQGTFSLLENPCVSTPCAVFSTQVRSRYLSLPPTRQDLTQSQWPEGRTIVGVKGGGGLIRAETQALLDYAGHPLT